MLRLKLEAFAASTSSFHPAIELWGRAMVPSASGTLYWEAEDTLLVADLHLEKGTAFAARGMLLPPYDTRETLRRLKAAIEHFAPRRVVALGDSFHRSKLAETVNGEDGETLRDLQRGREWYWVLGNHDPELPDSVGGFVCPSLSISGIRLRHVPTAEERGPEISGHLHPVARIVRQGETIRRKCFATDGRRLVMPAFGAYAGGLNLLDEAFAPLFTRQRLAAWMTGRSAVFPIRGSQLLPD